jgi:hypothetical protein
VDAKRREPFNYHGNSVDGRSTADQHQEQHRKSQCCVLNFAQKYFLALSSVCLLLFSLLYLFLDFHVGGHIHSLPSLFLYHQIGSNIFFTADTTVHVSLPNISMK